jgi:hypothetical protein
VSLPEKIQAELVEETIGERKVRQRRTAIESIKQYMMGNLEELSDTEAEIFHRYKWIQLTRTTMNRGQFSEAYCAEFGVSAGTAARDLALSNQLFGDQLSKEKEALRAMWLERADYTYSLAVERGDEKAMIAANAIASRLLGSPDKDVFIPDREQLGNNLYIFAPTKETERGMALVAEMLKKSGRLDLSKFPIEDAEIVEDNPENPTDDEQKSE